MRFAGNGAGGTGPSLGEAVLTHEGRGVVTAVDEEHFVVKMRDADGSRVFPLDLYEKDREGSFVRCVWDCGYLSHAMQCFLEKGHRGPHLFKLK